jgi:hypothetical protein
VTVVLDVLLLHLENIVRYLSGILSCDWQCSNILSLASVRMYNLFSYMPEIFKKAMSNYFMTVLGIKDKSKTTYRYLLWYDT